MAQQNAGSTQKGGSVMRTIIPIMAVVLFLSFPIQVFSGNVEFRYDELNRLEKAIYDDGLVITYTYDKAGNRSEKKTEYPPPVRNERTETTYETLQDAYDDAEDGDIIQIWGISFTDSLTANQAITVTLEGGYDYDWETNSGGYSYIKGSIEVNDGTVKIGSDGNIRLMK